MFRLILSVLATLLVVRVLFGLAQAVAAGLREGSGGRPVDGGRAAGPAPDSSRPSSARDRSPRHSAIDRDSVIDVPYTEIRDEEPSSAEGRKSGTS